MSGVNSDPIKYKFEFFSVINNIHGGNQKMKMYIKAYGKKLKG